MTQYKMGSIASSMATFRRCIKNFGDKSDVYNYYGELLLDQQKYQEAVEKFETAVEMEKKTVGERGGGMNVLPLINKALALFQWKQDFNAAEDLCQKALVRKSSSTLMHGVAANVNVQSIQNATLLLPPWLSSSCNRARSPKPSSTSSAPPSCRERKARSSTLCRTQRRPGHSSRCKKSTPSLLPSSQGWAPAWRLEA